MQFPAELSLLHILVPALSLLITLVAVWCANGWTLRRRLAIVIAVLSMLPPWLLPPRPFIVRAVLALVAFTWVMRVVDLSRVSWSFPRRVLHVLSVVDTRRLVHRAPRFDVGELVRTIVWTSVAAIGVLGLARIAGLADARHCLLRWFFADLAVYAAVSGLYRLLSFSYSAIGFDTPPLHLAPILARSVQELWGERWARPISDWLGDTFFRPFARRRRPLTGVLLAFIVSASFHAYGIWVGLGFAAGAAMAAWTFAYFLAQGAVMAIERRLKVRSFRPLVGHIWTIVWMIVLSPMFTEPIVRLLGLS